MSGKAEESIGSKSFSRRKKTERISDDDEANNAKEDRLSIEAIETKIEELEEQLQLAVENEDFDQADELNTNIEDLKKLQEAS